MFGRMTDFSGQRKMALGKPRIDQGESCLSRESGLG